jgi:hypothetical protein
MKRDYTKLVTALPTCLENDFYIAPDRAWSKIFNPNKEQNT